MLCNFDIARVESWAFNSSAETLLHQLHAVVAVLSTIQGVRPLEHIVRFIPLLPAPQDSDNNERPTLQNMYYCLRTRALRCLPMLACTRNRARLRQIIKAINQNSGGHRTACEIVVALSLSAQVPSPTCAQDSSMNVPKYAIQNASFATPSPPPRAMSNREPHTAGVQIVQAMECARKGVASWMLIKLLIKCNL